MKWHFWVISLALLAGCESVGLAPIIDNTASVRNQEAVKAPARTIEKPVPPAIKQQDGYHEVQKGDTLFAIAFQNNLDYRDLAFWNNLPTADIIKVGQVLRLTPPQDFAGRARGVETMPLRDTALPKLKPIREAPVFDEPRAQRLPYSESNWVALLAKTKAADLAKPVDTPAEKQVLPLATEVQSGVTSGAAMQMQRQSADDEMDGWRWPAEGRLSGVFGETGGKGIDITGARQTPIVATLPGKVVYSGAGLRGYGKMLIIKHQDEYLSAYAHNHGLLVKEGDWVKAGQKIAEMGDSDSDRVKLHFQIRQYGKPLDPLKLLPERK